MTARSLAGLLCSAVVVAGGAITAPAAHATGGETPTVRLRISTHAATSGDRVRLRGRVVAPLVAGGRVALQERRAGRWVRVALRRSNDRGRFRFVVTPDEGRHVYRVRARAYAGQAPARSRIRRVVVAPVASPPDGRLVEVRQQILDDTNTARRREGLPALELLAGANRVAQRWTATMALTGELTHNPSFAAEMPDGWTRVAENIAYGYEPEAVVRAWMGSTGHRANILGDHTHLGVGFVRDAQGRAWFTQNLGRY